MFLDPAESFVTMRQAAHALQNRLTVLQADARARTDSIDETAHAARIQAVDILVAEANTDDIFEQDALRRMFIAELAELAMPPATDE